MGIRHLTWIALAALTTAAAPAAHCRFHSRETMTQLTTSAETEFSTLRRQMVKSQLERRGIRDPRVLEVMRKVPREKFVLPELQSRAYEDGALPIGFDQTISQPYIVAFMTEALALTGQEKILEIGTGSGYQAAVLAEMVPEVYSVEIVEPLARRAEKILKELGYTQVRIRVGNGYEGWPEHGPYDAIVVTAAPGEIPRSLVEQLKPAGRMIVPIGVGIQELILVEKTEKGLVQRRLLPVRFVPMVDQKDEEE